MNVLGLGKKWTTTEPTLKLGGNKLTFVEQYKYLGHTIKSDLTNDCDIAKQVSSLYCRANILNKRFKLCTDDIKVLLFKLFCSNVYCASLWCNFKQASITRIKVAYNNAFRILMQLPKNCSASEMFVSRRVNTFNSLLRNLKYSLMTRVVNSGNLYVTAICTSDNCMRSDLFRSYEEELSTACI